MASVEPAPGTIRVEVAYAPGPGSIEVVSLTLPETARVADALQASGLLARLELLVEDLQVGVWSRVVTLDTPLRERDRVEIYRPLKVDPKEARRQRYKGQRERRGGSTTP